MKKLMILAMAMMLPMLAATTNGQAGILSCHTSSRKMTTQPAQDGSKSADMRVRALKKSGTDIEQFVPQGWTVTAASGDMNKDGISDCAIIATPNHAENMVTRDDGYVYNFNQPLLAIYFGNNSGGYTLWKQYDNILEPQSESIMREYGIEITASGVLRFSQSSFATAGGWDSPTITYVARFQNGDFYIIGMDEEHLKRNTLEYEIISYNYITNKCQRLVKDVSKDYSTPKETWTTIPKKPLKRIEDLTF